MTTFIRSFALLSWAVACSPLTAQDNCADYHRFNCDRSTDTRFSVNGQSKSASVQIGVPTELNIIVYNGQDYRISLCFDEKVIGDHVVIRLVEKVREPREITERVLEKQEQLDGAGKPTGEFKEVVHMEKKTVFEDVRKVLWDNQEHDMANSIEFTATATKRLMVEVTAPGAMDTKPKQSDKAYDIGCIGILIEHMPTPNVGFEAK